MVCIIIIIIRWWVLAMSGAGLAMERSGCAILVMLSVGGGAVDGGDLGSFC